MSPILKTGFYSALMVMSLPSLAQQYYLKPAVPCRVQLADQAQSQDTAAELPCGAVVKVLQRKAGRVQVIDESGSKGWVDSDNISETPPAEQQLQQLTEYQQRLEGEIAGLHRQVDELSTRSARLVEALLATEADRKAPASDR